MADAIAVSMKANGVKTMGYIGFADAYGDGWLAEMKRSAQTAGIKVVAEEKYNRNDPSVTGQVLKLVAAQSRRGPDRRRRARRARRRRRSSSRAATRARSTRRTASPTPTSCAWSARTATARSCRSGPMLVYEQLPDSNPVKKIGRRLRRRSTRQKYGTDSRTTFGGHAWDAYLLLAQAIPRGAEEGEARHASNSARRCATRSRMSRMSSARTACSR